MLSLALALQLFGAELSLAPDVHLVPPLALSSEEAHPPQLAAPVPKLESTDHRVRTGVVAGASIGVLVTDAATLIPMVMGASCLYRSMFDWSGDRALPGYCADAEMMFTVGLVGFLFLPPATGVLGARTAGERRGSGGMAYLGGLGVRFAGMLLFASLAKAGLGGLGFLAVDGVLVPYVIARVLANGEPPLPAPALAVSFARPERDPAMALAR